MAKFTLPGVRMKTDQDDARLRDALRDLDHWRDRANAAEQDLDAERRAYAEAENLLAEDLHAARDQIDAQDEEIERLRATALPPPMDGRPIEPTTDPVQALIAEALDIEIGGGQK